MQIPDEIILRGRKFTKEEISEIQLLVKKYFSKGRTIISEKICRKLSWYQPNGWLKDRACRDVIRALDKMGIIELPPPISGNRTKRYSKWKPLENPEINLEPVNNISGSISMRLVKGTPDETQWNKLVQAYHYLGHKVIVGRCLKFYIESCGKVLAAISLSEAAWAIKPRDRVLKELSIQREEVANNSRFLILPNVKIKNLASQILSLVAKQGVSIWEDYYSTQLKCLETFVDQSRYGGVCYKASNWINVGTSKGYRKSGSQYLNNQSPKLIFLYPLANKDREKTRNILFKNNSVYYYNLA